MCRDYKLAFYMIVVCLLFSSCKKQQSFFNAHISDSGQQSCSALDAIIQQEAMLVDVPIPLYDSRIIDCVADESDSDTQVFGYKSPLNYTQAIDFFTTQMERYGWNHLVTFYGLKALLQFESPDRYCTIEIQKSDAHSSVIFIYIKRASA